MPILSFWRFPMPIVPIRSVLRIHDPFTIKTVGNETFPHIWCFNLIPRQDGPNKVYIFLKLRAFCKSFEQQGRIQPNLKMSQHCEIGVWSTLNQSEVCGHIEIHLLHHATYFYNLPIFIIYGPNAKKACHRFFIYWFFVEWHLPAFK